MTKYTKFVLSTLCGVAMTMTSVNAFGQKTAALARAQLSGESSRAHQEEDRGMAVETTSGTNSEAPKPQKTFRARNYQLNFNGVEVGDLPDGWKAASENIATTMYGDRPAVKLSREGLTEVDLVGLFEQPGNFRFAITIAAKDAYRMMKVILVDEKGMELLVSIKYISNEVYYQFDDAERKKFYSQDQFRTFVFERTNAEKGNFTFKLEGNDSEIVTARKGQFGTLVAARIITNGSELAITDLRVEAKKSKSGLANTRS